MIRAFLRQLQDVPFEKKLTAFVAPVVVGVLLLFVGRILPESPQTPSPSTAGQPTRVPEQLEIVRVAVAEAEFSEDGEPISGPLIDITLRNVGDTVAVITAADIEVVDDARIQHCQPVTGGPLGVSFAYTVALPVDPSPNEKFTAEMSQSVAPNEADRVAIAVDAPEFDWESDTAALYALDVVLRHGPNKEPVAVGKAVVVFPDAPSPNRFPGWYVNEEIDPEFKACLDENESAMRRFLAFDGVKPEGLTDKVLAPKEAVVLGTVDQYLQLAESEGLTCTQSAAELDCVDDGPMGRAFNVDITSGTQNVEFVRGSSVETSDAVVPFFAALALIATGTADAEDWVLQSPPGPDSDPDSISATFGKIDVNFWDIADGSWLMTIYGP